MESNPTHKGKPVVTLEQQKDGVKLPPYNDCEHPNVPFVKSYYADVMVQRGTCPDCGTILLELD